MSQSRSIQEKRDILEMVAAGTISAEEGADLLDALENVPSPISAPCDAVKVRGTFRSLTLEGDPSIEGAVADGPARVRREGDTLIFEDEDEDEESFLLFGPSRKRRGMRIQINDRRFTLGEHSGPARPPALRIRMNPRLPLDLDLTAGTVRIADVHAQIKVRIAAGTAKLEGLTEPFDLEVEAGSIVASCKLVKGQARAHCMAGKIRINLDPSSDVHVTARSSLGKVVLPGFDEEENSWSGIGGGQRQATIGSGTGTLDLEATTGAIVVQMGS